MSNLAKSLWLQKKKMLTCFPIDEDGNDGNQESDVPSMANLEDDLVLIEEYEKAKLLFLIQDIYRIEDTEIEIKTLYRPPKNKSAPILICHHGAGSSAMTFWNLANDAYNELGYGSFLYDARGHGDSTESDHLDLSLEALTNDCKFVLQEFVRRHKPESILTLVGHSLGGAVFTNFLTTQYDPNEFNGVVVSGLVVIDIVEELAIRALLTTESFIGRMPRSFATYTDSIQWHLDSRLLNNYESAKISVCHLLKRGSGERLFWKCNFNQLPKFWNTWFPGLSKNFIVSTNGAVSKLLLLSTNETLDKELMIGQMQGKYQLIVFNKSSKTGHFLQEDACKQTLLSILDFIRRIELTNKLRSENNWRP